MFRSAIANMRSDDGRSHGSVKIREAYLNGPLVINVELDGVTTGFHGFHLHSSGNDLHGPDGLCSHFNPTGAQHGGRNNPDGHRGDFGNIYFDREGKCSETFIAHYLRYLDVIGRGLVVHQDQDDLGFGPYEDSKTTGHSGKRILWGVVGIDEHC